MGRAKFDISEWKIKAIGVSFKDGVRHEKPLEEFTKEELEEIAERKNKEALKAAGYIPVGTQVAI